MGSAMVVRFFVGVRWHQAGSWHWTSYEILPELGPLRYRM